MVLHDLRRARFWRRFFVGAFATLGVLSSAAGIVALFVGTVDREYAWLIWVGAALAVVVGAASAWPRPIETQYESPTTRIRVVRGDLFEQGTHIVVGTCDTFDTRAPHIAPESVQGLYLSRVYRGDADALDAALATYLEQLAPIESIEKPGNKARYEIGTVVPLAARGTRDFFVAYTRMDEANKAHGTADALWKSLMNLWATVRTTGNGSALSIPVLGRGQSGLSPILPPEDAIRFIALSFMIASRERPVCDELRIVALPQLFDRLDHFELQAFLSGLARS
jgi:hypothetical protein